MSFSHLNREEIVCLVCLKKLQHDNKPDHDLHHHKEKLDKKEKIPFKRVAPVGSLDIGTFLTKKIIVGSQPEQTVVSQPEDADLIKAESNISP